MRTSLALFVVVSVLLASCTERTPDRLQWNPTGPFRFERKGESDDAKVTAFVGPKPYTSPVVSTFSSSDTTVATVNDAGHIECTGSGRATLTATVLGVTATAEVLASVVGGLEVKADIPRPLKLNKKGHQLSVVVKDDKGVVIANPKLLYRATDYCVEVSDEGFLTPLTEGECDVIVTVAQFSQRVKLAVKE